MVKALDAVPYNERQWGNFLARNMINTKHKVGLSVSKNKKSRRVKKYDGNKRGITQTYDEGFYSTTCYCKSD